MGPKKAREVRKIEVPTDSVPEFELGDTAAEKRGEWGKRRRGRGTETEGGGEEGGSYTLARGVTGRKTCKDRQK